MVHGWLRPKTSSGLLSASASYEDSPSAVPDAGGNPSPSSAVASAVTGRNPADFGPSLNTRRSTHEFFSSARNNLYEARPRPSSSYLSFGSLSDQGYSHSLSSHPLPPQPAQSQSSSGQPRHHRIRAGFEEARASLGSLARKALHNSSRDMQHMRPIGRLSTHDSTLSTVTADTNETTSTESVGSSGASIAGSAITSPSLAPSTVSSSASTFSHVTDATFPPTHRPQPRSRRLSHIRDRTLQSRLFSRSRGMRTGQQSHEESGDRQMNDAPFGYGHDGQDVVMGNSQPQQMSSTAWSTLEPGKGANARASAASHNHGRSLSQHERPISFHEQSYDRDEQFYGHDEPQHKRRRSTKGKSRHHDDNDSMRDTGYDSMEIDPGLDEVMDRRKSPEPKKLDVVGKVPTEIAVTILSHLDDTSLARSARVSRRWYELARSSPVWRSSFLGRYARADENVLPYIQFGGQGLGRRINQPQQWLKMSRARRAIEKNWKAMAPKAVYFVGHTDSVYCCQFDEDKIITGSRDRTIRIWDLNAPYACRMVIGGPAARPVRPTNDAPLEVHPVNTVHQTRSMNGTAEGDAIYHIPTDYHTASILCLQFDKEIMVTGSSDHSCIVWDMTTMEPIQRLLHHTAGVLDVCMDDEYIISCSKDSNICVWDRRTFTLIKALHGHRGPVNAVQLREIGGRKLLVSASGDGLAKIWDLKKLEAVQQFVSEDRGLAAVEFSDDGKFVLAGGNDQVIYKFAVDKTRPIHEFKGHSSLVRSLFLDSANSRVVSGSYDQGIRVYNFDKGDNIGTYDNWTTSWILAAKSDYRRIVATSQDGRALLMDFGFTVPDAHLLAGHDVPISPGLPESNFPLNFGGDALPHRTRVVQ